MGYGWGCVFAFVIYVAGPCLAILGVILLYRAFGLWGSILGRPVAVIGAYFLLVTLFYAGTITAAVGYWVTGLVVGRDDGLPQWRPRGGIEYAAVGVGLTGAVAGALLGYHYGDGFWAALAMPLGAAALLVAVVGVAIPVVAVGGWFHRKYRSGPAAGGTDNRTTEPGE